MAWDHGSTQKQIKMKEDIGGWNQIHWNDGLPFFFFQLKVVREISQDGLVTKDPIGHIPLLHPICTFAIKAIHWENRLHRCVADPTARQRSSLNHSCIDHWSRFCLQPNWNVMSPKILTDYIVVIQNSPGWKHWKNIWISNKHPNCRWWHLLLLCALSCPARFQPLCANSDLVSQQDIRTDLWLVGIRPHWNPHGKVLRPFIPSITQIS